MTARLPRLGYCSALIALYFMLVGCQTLAGIESPEVSVAHIELAELGLFEQQWHVTLRAQNPNDRSLTLKNLNYTIFINDKKFAHGLTAEKVTLPALGEAQISTTITTGLLRSLQQLQQRQDETLTYRLTGKAGLGGLPFPVTFDKEDDLSLP